MRTRPLWLMMLVWFVWLFVRCSRMVRQATQPGSPNPYASAREEPLAWRWNRMTVLRVYGLLTLTNINPQSDHPTGDDRVTIPVSGCGQ